MVDQKKNSSASPEITTGNKVSLSEVVFKADMPFRQNALDYNGLLKKHIMQNNFRENWKKANIAEQISI